MDSSALTAPCVRDRASRCATMYWLLSVCEESWLSTRPRLLFKVALDSVSTQLDTVQKLPTAADCSARPGAGADGPPACPRASSSGQVFRRSQKVKVQALCLQARSRGIVHCT